MKVLDDFQGTTIHITVTIDGVEYVINVTQDRNIIENSIILTENDNEVANTIYQTYAPSLSQNVWPEKLVKGYMIKYRVKYKSISNTYKPKLTVHLSEGLRYVQFSNKVIYPDGTIIQIEPSNVELRDNTEFIYTNPYAININGYKLYSSFYMMAVNENPFLYFDWVNDQSNIQFIASNINWNRTFVGNNTDQYTITCNIIQSVQSDLGLTSLSGDILSEDYLAVLFYSFDEFRKKMGLSEEVTEEEVEKIQVKTDTAGYVSQVKGGEFAISGDEMRERFELNSPCFFIRRVDDQMRIVTKGLGHGYGMSQYAANIMASSEKNYKEILTFFFPGTVLTKNIE